VKGRRLRIPTTSADALAMKGRRLGGRVLRQVATIVTPNTILRWDRQLMARQWTVEPKWPGRPGIMREISSLIQRMAREKSRVGLHSDPGALKNLGHDVARNTVAKVLKDNGIAPAPDRPSSSRTFLRAHWGTIAGADFFTTEVWTPRGLVTSDTLFVLDLRSQRVHVAGSTPTPDAGFMAQAARRLTDPVDGFLMGYRVLIRDRDGKWTAGFRSIIDGSGVRVVLTPAQAPNANAPAGGVSRPPDPVRGASAVPRARRVRGVLPQGAESPGACQRVDYARDPLSPGPQCSLPRTVGRTVAVVPPRGLRM
jgi:putative transposase